MTIAHPKRIATVVGSMALGLALASCELRQDGAEEPAAEEPTGEPVVDPSEVPVVEVSESASASIIRDEVRGDEPIVPIEPVEVVIPFGDSGNDLDEGAERILVGVLRSEAIEEGWPVILRGHTDSSGNDSANIRASRARAEAVAAWLVERGVDDERIEVIPFGEQNPIAPNALPDGSPDEEGRARNRRVEIEIASPEAVEDEEDNADEAEGA